MTIAHKDPRRSPRARAAAASLGIDLDQEVLAARHARRAEHGVAPRAVLGGPRTITLLTGPSGSGKSTLLRRAQRLLKGEPASAERRVVIALDPLHPRPRSLPDRPLVDLFHGLSAREAMHALAAAGLAEGRLFFRTPNALSAGQQFRLRLALALHRARRAARGRSRPVALFIDEFASGLDAPTAQASAARLRRFLDDHPALHITIALAATRDDLEPHLAPHRVIRLESNYAATLNAPTPTPVRPRLRITEGSFQDYRRLAHLHYRAADPATHVRILVARAARQPEYIDDPPAGVLVVSMPTLNGAWRRHAWPERFTLHDKSALARRLNHRTRGVRCISRVIVEPRYRGMGVATMLVRAYLRRPLTAHTEAIAAMGDATRFFERAGMRRIDRAGSVDDTRSPHARLRRLLATACVHTSDLAVPSIAYRRACRAIGRQALARALRRWACASRATQSLVRRGATPLALFRVACRSIAGGRAVFVSGPRSTTRSAITRPATPAPRPTRKKGTRKR